MSLRTGSRFRRQALHATASALAIAAVTFVSYSLHLNAATVVLLYLLVIVCQSLAGNFLLSAFISVAAALSLDFYFLPPILSLHISDPLNILAFVVFLVIALVINRLVSRLGAAAERAQRRGANLEQLHNVTRHLLLTKPDHNDAAFLLKTFRDGFTASAACLFDGNTAEVYVDGAPRSDLAARTKQAYLAGADADDQVSGVVIRCLHGRNALIGAVGFEGLTEPEWVAGPLAVLAAAAMEQARAFLKASYEAAAAETEVLRTAILDALGHEFKTPLATILAVVGGLRASDVLGAEEAEMAGIIELETSRLNNLTDRLLRMARLDREDVRPRMRSTDIRGLVECVIRRYTTPSRDRYVAISHLSQTVEAPADRQLLDLALTQLLDNAFKYSVAGSAVSVDIGTEAGFIVVRVKNEGSSIAPQDRDRVFERFYRGAEVRKLVSGAGLGLYVARKIAVAHGGSLDLDKTASPGTVVFCLKLPMFNSNGNDQV